MGATFAEVKRLARRANHEENRRTMFFSSRVSIYITYLLSKTRVTANHVTYVFAAAGFLSSALVYLPFYWAPLAGFVTYRVHVVLDVVDGELARFRKTCSPIGAYLDYLTHYVVYSTAIFGFGVHHYLSTNQVSSVFCAFAAAIGMVMNLASRDCWYRANFGMETQVEGKERMWKQARPTLLAARFCSVNTVWFLYAAASFITHKIPSLRFGAGRDAAWVVLAGYAVLLPLFAGLRVFVTMKNKKIPRRAAWY